MHDHGSARLWLAKEYFEQNGDHINILEAPPSAVEFSRLIHISRPAVIKGFRIPALTRWSDEHLIKTMGQQQISVAVTPNGLADAVICGPGNQLYFVEPHVERMTMEELLSHFVADPSSHKSDIFYLQSQNGNVYSSLDFEPNGTGSSSEFQALRRDIPKDVPWCTKALGRPPDAVNLWIGDGRSVTSIHNDPYENIYTVVRGAKHFTLLAPTDSWCLDERLYPHAIYTRCPSTSKLVLTPSPETDQIRWSSISEPHLPGVLPPEAHPIHVTLEPGDSLYLPAGWWHHVRQSGGTTIAVNWWYDMEMLGMSWITLNFLRGLSDVLPENGDDEDRKGMNGSRHDVMKVGE